jgi:predicted transcriptional regulator
VGRKRTKKFQPGETMPVTFRLDAELAKALDAEAERLSEEMGFVVTRADVVRRWLKEVAARRSK